MPSEEPDLTFTADASAGLPGPEWLRRRRSEAFESFSATPLPSEKEEIWRYSPIDSLDLDRYQPGPLSVGLSEGAGAFIDDLLPDLGPVSALASGCAGRVELLQVPSSAGLEVTTLLEGATGRGLEEAAAGLGAVVQGDGDALVMLHDAFVPDGVVVDVAPGVRIEHPVVIVHWCDPDPGATTRPASFPRTRIKVGAGASVPVVEIVAGPEGVGGLVLPVTELSVGEGAHLAYVSFQTLDTAAWHIGRLAARVGAAGTLSTFTLGLGAAYDRHRTDAAVVGAEAVSEIRSAYLGTGTQVHDVRTIQDHDAPRTTSDLLCKGAVAGSSRSVYSGLIRIRHGAVRSNAMQTNHNLVLDESAHADSVPNLDIEENDVRCSHASTVGPIDEDQRYYLESRGIRPERAERLIVLGFFDDVVRQAPVASAVGRLQRDVAVRLTAALDDEQRAERNG